jgi:hypothetical protein
MNCNYIFYPDRRWIIHFSSECRSNDSLIYDTVSQVPEFFSRLIRILFEWKKACVPHIYFLLGEQIIE